MSETKKEPRGRTPLYTTARVLMWVVTHIFCPTTWHGGRELDAVDAPFILISNHNSMMDPLVVSVPIRRYEVTWLGKKELAGNRLTRWVFRNVHAIMVDRHASDMEAMRACMREVRGGGVLGIFPEGTRHHEGVMRETEDGVGLIALRAGVPIIPGYLPDKLRLFRRNHVWYGEPIQVDDLRAEGVNRQTSDALMARIRERYAEFVREHPPKIGAGPQKK